MVLLESHHTGHLKEDHATVDSLDDHSGLRLYAFDFFLRIIYCNKNVFKALHGRQARRVGGFEGFERTP